MEDGRLSWRLTAKRYSGTSIKRTTLFGGRRPTSRNNYSLYTVIRICIAARVIFFCFIPLSNGHEDLKLDVKIMEMWKRNCFFGFSSRYGPNYDQLDPAQSCFLVNLLNGQLTLLHGQLSRCKNGRWIEVRRYISTQVGLPSYSTHNPLKQFFKSQNDLFTKQFLES